MKISIVTCVGNVEQTPDERGDCWIEAIDSYLDLADEVVIVDGTKQQKNGLASPFDIDLHRNFDKDTSKIKVVYYEWPVDFNWNELPKHLNAGLNVASGDIVIRSDIDYVFHEKNIDGIKDKLELLLKNKYHTMTFQKYSFVLHNKYYQKGGMPIAINRKDYGDKIKFGHALDQKTDLCYPILWNGEYNPKKVPLGSFKNLRQGKVGLPFYNFDYTFKTLKQTKNEFWRFAKAYHRYYEKWAFGSTKEDSFNVFIKMMKNRLRRCPYQVKKMEEHPKYIRNKIINIQPEQFGHSGWNLLFD